MSRSSTTSLLLQKYNPGIGEKRKSDFDSLNAGGGLPPRSATMPPLKSILKKKQSSTTFGSSAPSIPTISTSTFYSNQRKGMFSRFLFFENILKVLHLCCCGLKTFHYQN